MAKLCNSTTLAKHNTVWCDTNMDICPMHFGTKTSFSGSVYSYGQLIGSLNEKTMGVHFRRSLIRTANYFWIRNLCSKEGWAEINHRGEIDHPGILRTVYPPLLISTFSIFLSVALFMYKMTTPPLPTATHTDCNSSITFFCLWFQARATGDIITFSKIFISWHSMSWAKAIRSQAGDFSTICPKASLLSL